MRGHFEPYVESPKGRYRFNVIIMVDEEKVKEQMSVGDNRSVEAVLGDELEEWIGDVDLAIKGVKVVRKW